MKEIQTFKQMSTSIAKVILALGGAGRSSHFAEAVSKNRDRFITSLCHLKRVQYPWLDGFDINWQDPRTDSDWALLHSLVKELKTRCGSMVVSIAYRPLYGGQARKLYQTVRDVDFFSVMTYDMHGTHHSSFEQTQMAVDEADRAGIPLSKLSIGIPFYAREIKNHRDPMSFEEIVTALASSSDITSKNEFRKDSFIWRYNGYDLIQKR